MLYGFKDIVNYKTIFVRKITSPRGIDIIITFEQINII